RHLPVRARDLVRTREQVPRPGGDHRHPLDDGDRLHVDLADVVAALVIGAPPAAVEAIADAIENVAAPGPAADALVSAAVPQPHTRSQALELSKSWQAAAPHTSGAALALALRSAARSVRTVRSTQTVELVWSGPSTDV